MPADTILHHAKIATNAVPTFVEALAITGCKIAAVGTDQKVFQLPGPKTRWLCKIVSANRCHVAF